MTEVRQHVVLVSGLSGAGKSTALKALEDMGYHCIDNLPASLMKDFAAHILVEPELYENVALGMDVRAPGLRPDDVPEWIDQLRESGLNCRLLFLGASDQTLVQRFGATRRPHPLAQDEGALLAAIEKERLILEPLRKVADWEIDTTDTNIHQLTHQTWRCVGPDSHQMTLVIQSFGFSKGAPADADLMFDARWLPNPHWQPDLRPMTGRDAEVAAWLEDAEDVLDMGDDIHDLLLKWLPKFEASHRKFLTVAIGCTGGRHRSVYLAERIAKRLRNERTDVMLHHRELGP